jgi:predicted Zn-dependent peptidase
MKRILLVFIFAVGWCSALAAELFDLSEHGDFRKIYFIPDPTARNIRVSVFLPVGESDRTGPEGLSHYLEHLVAWSADRVHGEGLRNREMNAWASPHWTAYWNRGPLESFGNMMRNARAVFDPVDLPQPFMMTERDVVEREFDLRYQKNPTAVLFREAYARLYGNHGFGRSVMGTPESIRQLSPQDAMAFHQERYRAADSYVLIYGPVTRTRVIESIKKYLTGFSDPEPLPRGYEQPLKPVSLQTLELALPDLLRDEVLIAGHAAAPPGMRRQELWFTVLLLNAVLNSSQTGSLQKPLYYDSFTVTHISANISMLPTGDIGFGIFFSPEDDVSTGEATQQVKTALRDLAVQGLPKETVDAIQQQLLDRERRLEQSDNSYPFDVAQNTILNLGAALDTETSVAALGRPTVRDLNAVLRGIAASTFVITAIARPEAAK